MAAPTMDDVAAESGMSRSLVSLVFQDSPKVSDASRERVLAAAEKLGYRPNVHARNLASTRTNTIGVLLDDLHNPFFADALDAIEDAAFANGFQVIHASGRRDRDRENDAIRTFLEHRVDGLILTAPRLKDAELARLAKLTPTVVIARRVSAAHLDVVVTDETVAAELVVEHLAALGHTEIAHIDGGSGPGSDRRATAFKAAMQQHGLKPRVIPGDYTEEAGQRVAAELVAAKSPLPTAIYCASDIEAAGVAAAFASSGVRIPDDVSLVGYDNTALAQLSLLSLTSVEQPLDAMATTAIELLAQRLDDRQRNAQFVELIPELVVRNSTATPRKQ